VAGVVFKSFAVAVSRWRRHSSTCFRLVCGCGGPAAAPCHRLAWNPVDGCGGLAYTLGIVFFALDRLRYFHATWHLFVLAGSVAHYFAILFYVVPPRT